MGSSLRAKAENLVSLARISPSARSVRREGLTYLSPSKLHRLEATLGDVLKANVPGDVVEFGVALGGSGVLLAKGARKAGRAFHGFDVFGMIPPPSAKTDDADAIARFEVIKSGASKGINNQEYYGYRKDLLGEVKSTFGRHGVPVDQKVVLLHKGLFDETIPVALTGSVAFAHIDCDWFDPVTCCLDAMAERLSPGGVMLIDDYHDYGGARKATDAFLKRHRDFRVEDGPNVILRRVA